MAWYLGLDFGTSTTAAAVCDDRDGVARLVRVDDVDRHPSSVFVGADSLLAGPEVLTQGRLEPHRLLPAPKRLLGEGTNRLAGRVLTDVDLVATVLRVTVQEALRLHAGVPPARTVLTHPARWARARVDVLVAAATAAGVVAPVLVPEPVAAARALLSRDEVVASVPDGASVALFDWGGGTLDVTVLRRRGPTFDLVGAPGGDERLGGQDVDEALLEAVLELLPAADRAALTAEQDGDAAAWERAAFDLRTAVRTAKEQLVRHDRWRMPLPSPPMSTASLELDAALLRSVAGEPVDRAIAALASVVQGQGLALADLAAVFLAGGSTRLSLVQRRLAPLVDGNVSTWGDPKALTALGAAELASDPVAVALLPAAAPDTPRPRRRRGNRASRPAGAAADPSTGAATGADAGAEPAPQPATETVPEVAPEVVPEVAAAPGGPDEVDVLTGAEVVWNPLTLRVVRESGSTYLKLPLGLQGMLAAWVVRDGAVVAAGAPLLQLVLPAAGPRGQDAVRVCTSPLATTVHRLRPAPAAVFSRTRLVRTSEIVLREPSRTGHVVQAPARKPTPPPRSTTPRRTADAEVRAAVERMQDAPLRRIAATGWSTADKGRAMQLVETAKEALTGGLVVLAPELAEGSPYLRSTAPRNVRRFRNATALLTTVPGTSRARGTLVLLVDVGIIENGKHFVGFTTTGLALRTYGPAGFFSYTTLSRESPRVRYAHVTDAVAPGSAPVLRKILSAVV